MSEEKANMDVEVEPIEGSFVEVPNVNHECSDDEIQALLVHFSKRNFDAGNMQFEDGCAQEKCKLLFSLDYETDILRNTGGEKCPHYPTEIPILKREIEPKLNDSISSSNSKQLSSDVIYENEEDGVFDMKTFEAIVQDSKYARCRKRFPCPVILFKGKYICRSATVALGLESKCRLVVDNVQKGITNHIFRTKDETNDPTTEQEDIKWDVAGESDIDHLKFLNITSIADLMVENKKLKYGVHVSSSEKVQVQKYCNFNILCLPYPGCEFFTNFRQNSYDSKGLRFEWNQKECSVPLNVPDLPSQEKMADSEKHRWDLAEITSKYMSYLLKYLNTSNGGLLIHCISGWDRTPLFISMIRLSLWADGLIHQHLNTHQILYLTIAYDWMLFGHQLRTRLERKEDIFYFCFDMLKFLCGEEFSCVNPKKLRRSTERALEDFDKWAAEAKQGLEQSGSTVSLSSECSTMSNNSQETLKGSLMQDETLKSISALDLPTESHSNSSSPSRRTTTPVSVPSRGRTRNSSGSSNFAIVSDSGSIRSSESNGGGLFTSPVDYVMESGSPQPARFLDRKKRLTDVRNLFLHSYWKTISQDTGAGAQK